MKELAALAVLTMPLLAILCIGGLAGFAGWAAGRRVSGAKKKWTASLATALAVVMVFTWDEIVGRMYFHYLCETEGGLRVRKQTGLPASLWNADGTQVFFPPRHDPSDEIFQRRLEFRADIKTTYPFNITGYSDQLTERATGTLLGSYAWFLYFGGWLSNATALHTTATSCHGYGTTKYEDFIKHVLVPEAIRR